jgi:hypothetical protein
VRAVSVLADDVPGHHNMKTELLRAEPTSMAASDGKNGIKNRRKERNIREDRQEGNVKE